MAKPSRKIWKGLGLIAGILVLGLLVAIPLAVQHYASAEYVEVRLSELLGRSVTVERVGLSFRPDLRVRAQGIVLEPELRVRAVEFALRPLPLLAGRLEARRVIFEGVRAEVNESDEAGTPAAQLQNVRLEPLFTLPALSFEDSEIAITSGEGESLAIHFDVLSLDPVRPDDPVGLKARGELRAADAASPFEAEARLEAVVAEKALGAQRGTFSLSLRDFHATAWKPLLADRLGGDWRADPVDLRVDGRYEDGGLPETTLSIQLGKGSVRRGQARVDGPGRLGAQIGWNDGELALRDVTLRAAGVRFRDHRFRSVRTRIDWDGSWLDVGEFSADAYVGSLGLAGSEYRIGRWARPLQLDVQSIDALEMSGRVRFSPPDEDGGVQSIEEADVRGLSLRNVRGELDAGSGALLPARVSRVTWESPSEGSRRVLQLEGDVDEENLRFRARVEAAGPGQEPVYDVELTVDGMDPSRVRRVWEDFVDAGVVENRVAGKIRIFESPLDGFTCDIDLEQDEGVTEIFGVRLDGAAQFSGRLERKRGMPMALTDATARAEHARFEGYEGEDANATFRLDESGLNFDRLAFQGYGGSWDLAGTTTLDASPRIYATGFFRDVRVETMRASDEADGAATRLSARGDIELLWDPKKRSLNTLSGRGDVTVADGAFVGQKLLAAVARGLWKALPVVGRAKTVTDPQSENPIHKGQGSYEVREGVLYFDALELATGDYDLVGTGSLAPNGDVEVRGDLTLTRAGVSKTTKRLTAPVPFKSAFRLPAVPIQIEGSLQDWDSISARADMKAIPVATLRGIVGLPARAGSIVRDAGKAARRMGEAAAGVVTGGGAAPEGKAEPEEPASGDAGADKQ